MVIINKPAGFFVHNTKLAGPNDRFILQLLRDQLGKKVFTTHRLDKKTTGALIFALNKPTQSVVNQIFRQHRIVKKYVAIVRGWTEDSLYIDSPLLSSNGKMQVAETELKTISRAEIDLPSERYQSSRYSYVELVPKTGRYHQLRRHLARINHPIIGDRPHGCNKQNRLLKSKFKLDNMILHASEVRFSFEEQDFHIKATLPAEFQRLLFELKL